MPNPSPAPLWLSIEDFAARRAGLAADAPQVLAVKAALLQAGMTPEQVASMRLRSLPEADAA